MIFYMKLSQTVSYIEKREIMKAETKSPLKKNGASDSKLSGRIWFKICISTHSFTTRFTRAGK